MRFDAFRKAFPGLLPYISILYYADMLFILPKAVFLMGKPLAAGAVLLLTALWTVHVIRLYYKKEINRKIHLIVIEADAAVRLPFAVNFLLLNAGRVIWYDVCAFVLNVLTIGSALISVYMLTEEQVKDCYD